MSLAQLQPQLVLIISFIEKNTALHIYFKEPKFYRTLEKRHNLENIYYNFKHEKNWRKLKKKIGLNLKNIAQS